MLDLIVRGGMLFDGGGGPPRRVDVGVAEGRVVELGPLAGAAAAETLEAAGAWVAPGFVDVHTHYDLCLGWAGLSEHCLRQGITSAVGANCGLGEPEVARALAAAAAARLGFNLGVLAPLGPLRSQVVPREEGRAASAAERPLVAARVAAALDEGALGVSWGPYHANTLMDEAELVAALGPAGRRGRPFAVHRRREGLGSLEATQEALALARAAGVPLEVSHLKAAGRLSWGGFAEVLERLEAARREQDVSVDVYPYDASLTYLSAIVPSELEADGGLRARLETASGRAAARAGIERWFGERMGPASIVLLEPALPEVPRGSDLARAAALLGCPDDPVEAAFRLLRADPQGTGGWAIYREMMDPRQVEAVLDLPWAAVASDAVPEEDGSAISAHPRAFATFARALVRAAGRGEAALADAVRRCTSFPARRFGIARGLLAVGEVADLVVLRDLAEGASYQDPTAYPRGVEAVVVGGAVALRAGELTGAAQGEVLRG
ncbi:MAG: amidohydrolase family protein [Planctomycetota bacterium]